MASNTYHHGELKSSLIDAAKSLLKRDGADALSLRSIAADVGVSHMAPYSHFKNKKELVQAIVASGFEELADNMEADSKDFNEPYDLILSYGSTYVEFAIANPQLYRLMVGQVETGGKRNAPETTADNTSKEMPSNLDKSAKRTFELLRNAFAMVYKDKEIISAQAFGAWALVHGMAALIIEGHFVIPKGTSIKNFLAMSVIRSPQAL